MKIDYEHDMAIRGALYKKFRHLSAEEVNSILTTFRLYDEVSLSEKLFAIAEGYTSIAEAMGDKIINDRRQ